MTTKIIYQGQVLDPSGYGVAGRGYIQSMYDYIQKNKLDIELKVVPISADLMQGLTGKEKEFLDSLSYKNDEELKKTIQTEDYHYIFHHPPTYARKIPITKELATYSESTTCITVWETDVVPPIWNDIFEGFDVDKIVVPCEWNRETFVQSLQTYDRPVPVIAVPHLINDEFIRDDNPETLEDDLLNEDNFNILTVGQWTDRKALLNVVKAFLMEFKNEENCSLFVKTYGNIQDPRPEYQQHQQQEIAHQIVNLKRSILGNDLKQLPKCNLHLLYGLFPKSQMNFLYKNSDLFALFSKSEGFGLPIAEALVNETPVIVHNQGGHTDFTDPENNFIVECHKTPAHCTVFPHVYSCDSNWFETDFYSARKQLRAAFEEWKNDKDAFEKRGKLAKDYMLKITGDSAHIGEQLVQFVLDKNA